MTKLTFFAIFWFAAIHAFPQVCTVTGTSPLSWPTNGGTVACSEGGFALGKTTLIIPAGFTVDFDDNADTWSGTEIQVFGTLTISANPVIHANIRVKTGGILNITGKLELGTSAPSCNYYLAVGPGGTVTLAATASDRLTICGEVIMKGAGGCNTCGGTNNAQCAYDGTPYCQPPGGFVGPRGYDENGYNSSLPVNLHSFTAEVRNENVVLDWATSMEENFSKFIIQRSVDGLVFEEIGEVPGKGFNIYDIVTKYSFEDQAPLLGLSYYRLKAVDLDDSFEYFGPKAVRTGGSRAVTIYPNPSSGELISFRTNFSPSESDRVVLTDQLGSEVFSGQVNAIENKIYPVTTLRPGIYMLRYISDDFEQVCRVVVRN